jgi:hypothetical protein
MNEPTFRRSPHNKLNPYVQISREMAQDKSISPKAKGVLLYLLSLPDDWKVYHSQLQRGLGIGEDYLNSAMDELLNAGYAERTREKVKGLFQPYQYTINEFKICLPDRENQPGSTGPENPGIHNTYSPLGEQKKQQQAAPAAAVFSESSKKEKTTLKIYDCLKPIDIPMKDKYEISTRYDEETVKNAVDWATHKDNPPTKCLAASIKHACKHKLSIKEHEVKSRTPYERARDLFKNGSFYNNAECFLNANGISFSRGMLHYQVNFDKFFNWNRVKDLCKKFQILIPELK